MPLRSALFAVCAAVVLSACSSDGGSGRVVPQETPPPGSAANARPVEAGPSVNWRAFLQGDTVVVEIADRNNAYRVDTVALLAPDGRTIFSNNITRERLTPGGRFSDSGVGVGVGGSGGSSGRGSVGVMFGFPLGGGGSADPYGSEARTTARIRLPDPAGYRATAEGWRLRLTFSDLGGGNSAATIPRAAAGILSRLIGSTGTSARMPRSVFMEVAESRQNWTVRPQIVEDPATGLSLLFQVSASGEVSLTLLGKLPFGNREFIFDRDGGLAGTGLAPVSGGAKALIVQR